MNKVKGWCIHLPRTTVWLCFLSFKGRIRSRVRIYIIFRPTMNIATEDLTSVEWRDTAWLEVRLSQHCLHGESEWTELLSLPTWITACRRISESTDGHGLLFNVSFLGSPVQQPDSVYANSIQWFTKNLWSHPRSPKVLRLFAFCKV